MADGGGLIDRYPLALVALSIVAAALVSYIAFALARRIAASRHGVPVSWLVGQDLHLAQDRASRAEQALRATEERLRLITEGTDASEKAHRRADATKADFTSFVSHQLRTPLTGVSWMLELAADSPGLTPDVAEYLAEARASTHRLIQLVNDLLEISRLESGRISIQRENFRLDALISSVVDALKPAVADKQLEMTVVRAACEPVISADAQLMRQVVMNLLSNAIKYTPAGGRIDIAITMRDDYVVCAFRDTGIGVPAEAQARLFEKFYRADNASSVESEGTGLGLSVVRLTVEHFGGRVWCESVPGEGALFTIELPAIRVHAQA